MWFVEMCFEKHKCCKRFAVRGHIMTSHVMFVNICWSHWYTTIWDDDIVVQSGQYNDVVNVLLMFGMSFNFWLTLYNWDIVNWIFNLRPGDLACWQQRRARLQHWQLFNVLFDWYNRIVSYKVVWWCVKHKNIVVSAGNNCVMMTCHNDVGDSEPRQRLHTIQCHWGALWHIVIFKQKLSGKSRYMFLWTYTNERWANKHSHTCYDVKLCCSGVTIIGLCSLDGNLKKFIRQACLITHSMWAGLDAKDKIFLVSVEWQRKMKMKKYLETCLRRS